MCVQDCVWVCAHDCMWRTIATEGLSLNLGLVDVARLACQQAPELLSSSPSTEVTGTRPHPGLYKSAQDPNSNLLFAQ